ncbi:capsular polysaccharide transport system permease protein [Shimia marina]|uniref:Transport permease protein n=2 Tax=Shimia marina TaxID=321267 RepID=A0A0P1EMQ3_9RHOB|nr:Polysialic acid transport protein KpsM [Shimia marina]SFD47521.1 capsular polysaccharide transport system permease protein [Shimia marina]
MPADQAQSLSQVQKPAQGVKRSFASFRAISALILREMSTRYGRSPGGYVWAIMEPLGGILLLSLGFSLVMRTPALGNSFLLFYATGVLPFSLYNMLSGNVMRSLFFSKALLQYPAVTWADAIIARFILTALTQLMVMFILVAGILLVTKTRVILEFNPIVVSVLLSMLLGTGVGVLNCAIFGLFPVWAQVWSILNRPLFIASGIFFLIDDLPPVVQDILWWNPVAHVVSLMRTGFYPTYRTEFVNITFVLTVGIVTLFLGIVLVKRYHRDILNSR